MKRKLKSSRGFTLAELLIVVAIIAVLVAIGIPIFTSQLERSREAVDLSEVRSAYAEVMMAAITGDTTAYYTKDVKQNIYKSERNVYSITVQPLKQKQDGWQTPLPITIGGVSSNAGEPCWKGNPGPAGSCVITYHPPVSGSTEYVSFEWSGGTNEAGGGGSIPGGGGSTPGGSGEGAGGGGKPGGNETSNQPSSGDIINTLKSKGQKYPDKPTGVENTDIVMGNVYYYGEKLYIGKTNKTLSQYYYGTPEDANFKYLAVPPTGRIVTSKNVLKDGNETMAVKLSAGDIYRTDEGILYIRIVDSNVGTAQAPTTDHDTSRWVKINV